MQKKPSNLVSIDNKLAQASYSLNLSEQRLLFIILSKIKPSYHDFLSKEEVEALTLEEATKRLLLKDKRSKELIEGDTIDSITMYYLPVRDYADFCNLSLGDARHELIEAAKHLKSRAIYLIKEDKSFNGFCWVQSVEYNATNDTIGIRWSYDILPYIQNLSKYFTKLKLNNLLGLRSTYSWKLYQLLLSKKGENIYKKQVEIEIESLLFSLDVPESCKEFKHFNSKILQRCMKEIESQKLFEDFKVTKVLQGKKVISLSFSWLNEKEIEEKRAYEKMLEGVKEKLKLERKRK